MIVLIDADSIVFKLAITLEDNYQMRQGWKRYINEVRVNCWADDVVVGIKGTDRNFRYDIYPSYKSNRRPLDNDVKKRLNYLYEHAYAEGAIKAHENWETDDQVADWVLEAWHNEDPVTIAHIDKDLDLLPGSHYNFNKNEHYELSIEDCQRNFFYQLLVGDSADGLPGARGIGKVKANKLLDENLMGTWYRNIRRCYPDRVSMDTMARCLFMGNPDNFTYNLEDLYAKEEKESNTDLESLPSVEPDGE